jgi:hypothetical protein
VSTPHAVRVDRERGALAGMPEDFLGALEGYAGLVHQGARHVAQVMEAKWRKPRTAQCPAEDMAQQNVGVDGVALAGCVRLAREHQAARGERTRELPTLDLGDQVGRNGDRPHAALGLGRRLLAPPIGLALDEQSLALEVDRIPGEPADFAPPAASQHWNVWRKPLKHLGTTHQRVICAAADPLPSALLTT